jgi:integrase
VTAAIARCDDGPVASNPLWDRVRSEAPILAQTCRFYVEQIVVSARPATVIACDRNLRYFADWLVTSDPPVTALKNVKRVHIEGYKRHLAQHETPSGKLMKPSTITMRLGIVRVAIERLIEWDHPDAPARNPIFGTDLPKLDQPLPKFLDDEQATKFMHAATRLDPQRRLVCEMLIRTGIRIGELCALRIDAVRRIGDTAWLQVPVGKLHTDRYIPLHPILLELLDTWRTSVGPNTTEMLITNATGGPLDRYSVSRTVARCARWAGIGHVHPHQLRHTLATQAINRGMSLEAIAAMLGHKSMRMTLTYARIADRTVADQYFTAANQIDNMYETP